MCWIHENVFVISSSLLAHFVLSVGRSVNKDDSCRSSCINVRENNNNKSATCESVFIYVFAYMQIYAATF